MGDITPRKGSPELGEIDQNLKIESVPQVPFSAQGRIWYKTEPQPAD